VGLVGETVLGRLGASPAARAGVYRRYVEESLREGVESPWAQLIGQGVLGDEAFVGELQEAWGGNAAEQAGLRALRLRPKIEAMVGVVEQLKGEPWQRFRDR
jgi:hypothetical protein